MGGITISHEQQSRLTAVLPSYVDLLFARIVREFFSQVAGASGDASLFYLALSGALVIPDMCGAMDSEDGRANGDRYAAWFDAEVGVNYPRFEDGSPYLSGADCYRLRCSFLHQGTTQHSQSRYARIIFLEPSQHVLHLNVMEDALNLDIRCFCFEMTEAAMSWLDRVEDTPPFRRNYPKFMQRYPEGMDPYFGGATIIT